MDEAFTAYRLGHADGLAGRRDETLSQHRQTGPDYRIGLLDGRIMVFHQRAEARRQTDDS